METEMKLYGDTFTELNIITIKLRELNIKLATDYRQKSLYDLFIYLVYKNYKIEAAEIWNKMILNKFFTAA